VTSSDGLGGSLSDVESISLVGQFFQFVLCAAVDCHRVLVHAVNQFLPVLTSMVPQSELKWLFRLDLEQSALNRPWRGATAIAGLPIEYRLSFNGCLRTEIRSDGHLEHFIVLSIFQGTDDGFSRETMANRVLARLSFVRSISSAATKVQQLLSYARRLARVLLK
jgi:hypothetical protein